MGTSGAYGFYKNGETKVMFNHWDSYPEGLGQLIVDFILVTPLTELHSIADRIQLVQKSVKPTPQQIEELKEWADTSVSSGELDEWYVLLRKAQKNIYAYQQGLNYMLDASDYLLESRFCNWAYIINLDDEVLEIYKGYNKDADKQGRYRTTNADEGYLAVKLFQTFPLTQIPSNWLDIIIEKIDM